MKCGKLLRRGSARSCGVLRPRSASTLSAVEARDALRETLTSEGLAGIPLLVLGNKSDLPGALGIPQLVDALGLRDIAGREVRCFSISCKLGTNVDAVLRWLTKHARKRRRERGKRRAGERC